MTRREKRNPETSGWWTPLVTRIDDRVDALADEFIDPRQRVVSDWLSPDASRQEIRALGLDTRIDRLGERASELGRLYGRTRGLAISLPLVLVLVVVSVLMATGGL